MIAPLIFDLDGTLVDSLPAIAASLNRSLVLHGLPEHSHAAIRSFIGDGMLTLIRRAAPQGSSDDLIDSLARCYKADYETSWKQGTEPYPEITRVLMDLQSAGHSLAVLSNKTHEFVEVIVRDLFSAVYFSAVQGHSDNMPHKPDPAGAHWIADIFGESPQHCIIIGDSTMDIDTANRAGMKSVGVTWGYQDDYRLKTAGATAVADSPDDLPSVLSTLGGEFH